MEPVKYIISLDKDEADGQWDAHVLGFSNGLKDGFSTTFCGSYRSRLLALEAALNYCREKLINPQHIF